MYQRFGHILLLAIALLLSGCLNIVPEAKERVRGRLLIWHPFEGKEAETLNSMLAQYRELYPQIKVISEFFPEKIISEQFRQKSQSGLGPDLMISPYDSMIPLIRAGVLETLDNYNLNLSSYLPRPISQVTLNNNLYGLPFALGTQVLCYNKTKVERPFKTLPEMITEAETEHQIALNSSFLDTFWGMQIFRSKPKISPEKREIIFDSQAWANWLEWLRVVQKDPDFILADEGSTLERVFAEGKLAYYVCYSEELSDIQATLGADKLGVTTLPGVGNRAAGPLLYTKAIMFNQASPTSTTKLALQLARFLTNAEQQTKLALETESLIPANNKVKLDRRLSPIQAVLLAQSKTAVAVSLDNVDKFDNVDEIEIYGNLYYHLVMAGEMEPLEASEKLRQKMFAVSPEDAIQSGEE